MLNPGTGTKCKWNLMDVGKSGVKFKSPSKPHKSKNHHRKLVGKFLFKLRKTTLLLLYCYSDYSMIL